MIVLSQKSKGQKNKPFYVGINTSSEHNYISPYTTSNEDRSILGFEISVVNQNRAFGAHAGYYFSSKWHIETGVRWARVSDGRLYDRSDSISDKLSYTHQEFEHIRIPLLIGISTKPNKNFRFSCRTGLQYARVTNAKTYIYDNIYYDTNGLDSLVARDYTKSNGKPDDKYDNLLSYDEFYGISDLDNQKFRKNIWYYHLQIGFEFKFHSRMTAALDFYFQSSLHRINNMNYEVNGDNFWNETFIASPQNQMHKNRNFGAMVKLNYNLSLKSNRNA